MGLQSWRFPLRQGLGVIALLVAAGLLLFTADTAMRVARESRWPVVPATLDSVELHRPGSATSRSLSVGARYHYDAAGQTRTGTRVSVYAPDSLGSFFRRTYDDLHGRLERHETVPAHVNPDAPDEAVLLPVWRVEVFAFRLLLVAVALIAAAVAFRVRPWARQPVEPDNARQPDGPPDAEQTMDRGTNANEKATPRVARGRRVVLAGFLLLAAAYVLLERSSGDSFALIDRLLASRVIATGTVFVSPADARVRTLFDAMRAAQGVDASLVEDSRHEQGTSYRLTATGRTRDAALASIDRLRSGLEEAYHAQAGRDLSTFADAYVAPDLTRSAAVEKTAILAVLLGVGVVCLGAGAVMLIRVDSGG